jgi:hypothetical protein
MARRFFFVTYCFGSPDGQALIGVYKRGLRLALELQARGHEVSFFCTGREAYRDRLTEAAERRLRFVDIPFAVAAHERAAENRRLFLDALRRLAPDVIVVGEAPLAGALLEATLCGVEAGVPVVFLDNAYNPLFGEHFRREAGAMADGVVLMGPSSHHAPQAPPHVCATPPFIDADAQGAARILARLGLGPRPLVTVLAYDRKVETLGASLVDTLDRAGADVLFCARDEDACRRRLDARAGAAARARVLAAPAEELLLGLLELSALAVVKYGFMQVAECLTLRTPALAAFHEGPTWLDYLPETSRRFVHGTSEAEAGAATRDAARRLLALGGEAMAAVHAGERRGVLPAADFLERLPSRPRGGTLGEVEALGFDAASLREAVAACADGAPVTLRDARALRLRVTPAGSLYSLLCHATVGGASTWLRLWGRRYLSPDAAAADIDLARAGRERRRPRVASAAGRLLIEDDLGEALLPELNP